MADQYNKPDFSKTGVFSDPNIAQQYKQGGTQALQQYASQGSNVQARGYAASLSTPTGYLRYHPLTQPTFNLTSSGRLQVSAPKSFLDSAYYKSQVKPTLDSYVGKNLTDPDVQQSLRADLEPKFNAAVNDWSSRKTLSDFYGITDESEQDNINNMMAAGEVVGDTDKLKEIKLPFKIESLNKKGGFLGLEDLHGLRFYGTSDDGMSITDFLDIVRNADDGAKNDLIGLITNRAQDANRSAYERQAYSYLGNILYSANEGNNDYRGMLDRGLASNLNRLSGGFFGSITDIGAATGLAGNVGELIGGNDVYNLETNYLTGQDWGTAGSVAGSLGGFATDMVVFGGLQGAVEKNIATRMASNTARIAQSERALRGTTNAAMKLHFADDIADTIARNRALGLAQNILGAGGRGGKISKVINAVGTYIDPVGNLGYGMTYAAVHPDGQYGDEYGLDDFVNDAIGNAKFIGGAKLGLKALSRVGQTYLGKAATMAFRDLSAKVNESKVGQFFGRHFGDGYGELRNVARRADLENGTALNTAKLDDAITQVNRGGVNTMSSELSKAPHTQETMGVNGQWDNFSKKYHESNPLGRKIDIYNPETNRIEKFQTTDAISANAEEALGEASKYYRFLEEADGARTPKYRQEAMDYADKVKQSMISKFGDDLTNDALDMVDNISRSKQRGGSINSDLEDIMTKHGLNDAEMQKLLEEADPRFANTYMTMHQYRPSATEADTMSLSGTIGGHRTSNLENIYKAKYQNPMRAYQMKVVAVGKAIAWNNLKRTMTEIDQAMGNVKATFTTKQIRNVRNSLSSAKSGIRQFNDIIENAVGDLNVTGVMADMVDTPLGGTDSAAAKLRANNPDAFVPDDELVPNPQQVATPQEGTSTAATADATTGELTDAEVGELVQTPVVRDETAEQVNKAFQSQQRKLNDLRQTAIDTGNSGILTSSQRRFNALDGGKSEGLNVAQNIVGSIPTEVLDQLDDVQLRLLDDIRFGNSTDWSVVADSPLLRNYFDMAGVHAIRRSDGTMLYLTDKYRLFNRDITDKEIYDYIDMDMGGDGITQATNLVMERTVDTMMRNDDIYQAALEKCMGTNMTPRTFLMNVLAGQNGKNSFRQKMINKVVDRLRNGSYRYQQTIDILVHEIEPDIFPKRWKPGANNLKSSDFKNVDDYKRYQELSGRSDVRNYADQLMPSTKDEITDAVNRSIDDYVQTNYVKDNTSPDELWNLEELTKTDKELKTQKEAVDIVDSDPLRRTADFDGETVSYYKLDTPNGPEYHLTTDITSANLLRNATRKMHKHDSVSKIMNASSRIYRFGTTSANWKSLVRNMARDPIQAWLEAGWDPTDVRMQYPGGIYGYCLNSDEIMQQLRTTYGEHAEDHLTAVAQDVADQLRQAAGATELSTITGRYNSVELLQHQGLFRKVINFAERPGDVWESTMRGSVGAQIFTRYLKQGYSIEDALAMGKFYASNATTNFTNAVGNFTNLSRNVPYLSAAINGTRSFWRMMEMDPLGVTTRIATTIIGPQILTVLENLTDPEKREKYENIPDWVKQQNLIYITDEGDCIIMPLPQEVFPFLDVTRRFVETSFGLNPEPWYKTMGRGFLGFSPIDVSWLADLDPTSEEKSLQQQVIDGTLKTASSLVPQWGQVVYESTTGKDLFTGADLYAEADSPTLTALTKFVGMNVDNSVDKQQNTAIVQNILRSTFGTGIDYVINGLDTLLGAPEEERGGKSFLEDMSKTFTGEGYQESNAAFNDFISKQEEAKEKLMTKVLPDYDKKISAAEETSDRATVEGLKAERQKLIDDWVNDVKAGLDKYTQMFQATGGLDRSRKNRLLNLMKFDLSSLNASTGNLNEESWQGEAYNEAESGEYQDALHRYQQLGLTDEPDMVYKDSSGNYKTIQSFATRTAIQDSYGAPKQMVYDVENALSKENDDGVSLWDVRNQYKDQISQVYDEAEANGTDPDYDKIADLQYEFLKYFDDAMQPIVDEYGPFIANNYDVIDSLRGILNGMIPTETYQKDKYGRFRSMPLMEVDLQKWLQKRYGVGQGNLSGMPSDEEVTSAVNRINEAIRNGRLAQAQALAQRINNRIGRGEVYATGSDMDIISNVLGY